MSEAEAIELIAEAVAHKVMVRLAPFFLGVLDGAEVEAPKPREALAWLIAEGNAPPKPPPSGVA